MLNGDLREMSQSVRGTRARMAGARTTSALPPVTDRQLPSRFRRASARGSRSRCTSSKNRPKFCSAIRSGTRIYPPIGLSTRSMR